MLLYYNYQKEDWWVWIPSWNDLQFKLDLCVKLDSIFYNFVYPGCPNCV